MNNRLPNSHPDRTPSSGQSSPKARSEIIVSSLKKLSQLLVAYDPRLEIMLCEGGIEISCTSEDFSEGMFMPIDEDSADSEFMLSDQLQRFELKER